MMLNEDRIADISRRKARVGDQMLYEVRHNYGMQTYVHNQHIDISFDEAVLRASAGERLWEPWF